MNAFYNVGSADISQGLQDFEISSGQDYFILLSAPSNANIHIRLNENTAPQIPIKEHWQFKSADVKKVFISADAISGESIKWGQADGNLEITTNPTINQIGSISQMGSTFLEQMDKIVNPYQMPTIITGEVDTIAGARTKLLTKSLSCDKIIIDFCPVTYIKNSFSTQHGNGTISLDGVNICAIGGYNGTSGQFNQRLEIENVNGKVLEIEHYSPTSTYTTTYILQQFKLKP